MKLQKKIHLKNNEHDRGVVERLVDENINGKLDKYLKKFDNEDVELCFDLSIEQAKMSGGGAYNIGLFKGKLNVDLNGKIFHFEREDFKKLDDLVNHLFDHLKEALAG